MNVFNTEEEYIMIFDGFCDILINALCLKVNKNYIKEGKRSSNYFPITINKGIIIETLLESYAYCFLALFGQFEKNFGFLENDLRINTKWTYIANKKTSFRIIETYFKHLPF